MSRVIGIVAGLGLICLSACSSSRSGPHGNPDPGSKRIAYIALVARRAVPPGATAVHLHLKKSHWDPGGCDGGAAGWSRMEADQVFMTSGHVAAQIDAAMKQTHWHSVPVMGGSAGREYEPNAHNGYGAVGWLFSSNARQGRTWQLQLSAAPAEVPTHAC